MMNVFVRYCAEEKHVVSLLLEVDQKGICKLKLCVQEIMADIFGPCSRKQTNMGLSAAKIQKCVSLTVQQEKLTVIYIGLR